MLSKIRARLGLDEVESVNVGAAPTPYEVIEFFHAIGIPLAELWDVGDLRLRRLQPASASRSAQWPWLRRPR